MLFKDVKTGNSVYIFDRNAVTVAKGTVTAISLPHVDTKSMTPGMVVDVTINVGGKNGQYVVPETSEAVTIDSLLLTPNASSLLSYIQSVKQQRESVLNSIDQYRKDVESCNALLAEYDPVYKDKQETEARLQKIERVIEGIPAIQDAVVKIADKLDKIK